MRHAENNCVWQQSVALFNELWEQKLKKSSHTVCNNINTRHSYVIVV